MKTHIAFQFGEVLIATEALAAPLFDDVLSRHAQDTSEINVITMPIGKRVEITDRFREKYPDDTKLIDAANVLTDRAAYLQPQ